MAVRGTGLDLKQLMDEARAAPGLDRIEYRDPIARYGDPAIIALEPWLTDPILAGFAVRTITVAASYGSVDLAIATLRTAAPMVRNSAVHGDILAAAERLATGGRTPVDGTRGKQGAVVSGGPTEASAHTPPLNDGERDLLEVLVQGLPDGWTIFVRPHLDGDRPALALLHPERGAMVWDVRELDVAGLQGSPKAYHDSAGVPYLDPVEKINAIRQRLYSEYLPGWAEAIDEDTHRYGIVRAGIYFPNSQLADLARLGLTRQHEVIIGRGGLRERAIESLVPNAHRTVDMEDDWYEVLHRRFAEYHRPSFSLIRPSKRQQELIDDPLTPEWRGLEGVAGSGKSLVLARRATRLAREGKRVLLVTYNLTLANYCRGLTEDAPDRFRYSNLVVQHFHGLCHVLLRELHQPAPLHPAAHLDSATQPAVDPDEAERQEQDHFERRWPLVVRDALTRLGRPPEFSFDIILVDEAQDFSEPFFDVLEQLLAPEAGVLLAFDRAQRLYARADGVGKRLDMRKVKKLNGSRRLRLRHANIATALGASRQLPTERIELDDESPVLFADDDARWIAVTDMDSAIVAVGYVLEAWRSVDGYRTDGTVVLVPSVTVGQALVSYLGEFDFDTNHVFPGAGEASGRRRKVSFVPHDQRIKVATIHSFKGWEADDVVVVEPPSTGLTSASQVYVALTRPKSRLVVVASSDPYGLRQHFDADDVEVDDARRARADDLLTQARAAQKRRREHRR